jgi:hypothetical protein
VIKELIERWRERRAARQVERCAAGRHHWKSIAIDYVRCCEPGCGKRYGS